MIKEKPQARGKRGRYKKKEKEPATPSITEEERELIFDDDDDLLLPSSEDESLTSAQDSSEERYIAPPESTGGKKKPKKEKEAASVKGEKKLRWRSDRSKNFVKITGSYQDEFVYFTSKNHRKGPRKFNGPMPDSPLISGKAPKPPPVGGTVNVFDWYRDMANTDKTQFGGISGSAAPSENGSPQGGLHHSYSDITTGYPSATTSTEGPKSEAEVVDLVCELSGLGGNEVEVGTTDPLAPSDLDMNSFLNSIGEDGLKMLDNSLKRLGDGEVSGTETKPDVTPLHETSFDGFLANFSQENGPNLSQTSNPMCDLDEINDSDLLQSDIGNMNAFFDMAPKAAHPAGHGTVGPHHPAVSVTEENLTAVPPSVANPLFKPVQGPSGVGEFLGGPRLDKTELFPDVPGDSMASAPGGIPTIPLTSDTTAPELTVVSMYWNDLPGLFINGEQYVRLVDIHKQVLPAKDTGILKKRCQMMGLPIHNCTELARDFLMRYANAAKSKSTVIVSKASAQTLIGFYVDPRPRTRGDSNCKDDLHSPTRKGKI